jgi:hypothetical protein
MPLAPLSPAFAQLFVFICAFFQCISPFASWLSTRIGEIESFSLCDLHSPLSATKHHILTSLREENTSGINTSLRGVEVRLTIFASLLGAFTNSQHQACDRGRQQISEHANKSDDKT